MPVTCENHKLTGRRRHRVQQRLLRSPLLVLPLKLEHDSTEWSPYGDSGPTRQHTVWRDAAVEDGAIIIGTDMNYKYIVNGRRFVTLEAAKAYAAQYHQETGVFVAIEELDMSRALTIRRAMTYNFNKTLHSAKGHKIEIDDKAFYGCWEYPDGSEGGGLWFEHDLDGKLILCDYDGVFELPRPVVAALRADGYHLDEDI